MLERFEDGRLNILVEGTQPFRLTRRIEDLPYPAGHVEPLTDDGDTDEEALERARSRYADLVEEVTETRPEPDALAELDAYGMAATLEVAPAAKQTLLELRSESGRLEQLEALFVGGAASESGWPSAPRSGRAAMAISSQVSSRPCGVRASWPW